MFGPEKSVSRHNVKCIHYYWNKLKYTDKRIFHSNNIMQQPFQHKFSAETFIKLTYLSTPWKKRESPSYNIVLQRRGSNVKFPLISTTSSRASNCNVISSANKYLAIVAKCLFSPRTKGIALHKSVKSSDFEYGGNKRRRYKAEVARWR